MRRAKRKTSKPTSLRSISNTRDIGGSRFSYSILAIISTEAREGCYFLVAIAAWDAWLNVPYDI